MIHGHLQPARPGRYMRTNQVLVPWAPDIAALRRSGVTVRGIAASLGASRSGVHGLLARLGLAGVRPARPRQPVALSRTAAEAVALLVHPLARRLTWRQRAALQGRVRGMASVAIAADLGIRPESVCGLIATARRRMGRPWRRRSRARRPPPADLAALLAAMEAEAVPMLAGQDAG